MLRVSGRTSDAGIELSPGWIATEVEGAAPAATTSVLALELALALVEVLSTTAAAVSVTTSVVVIAGAVLPSPSPSNCEFAIGASAAVCGGGGGATVLAAAVRDAVVDWAAAITSLAVAVLAAVSKVLSPAVAPETVESTVTKTTVTVVGAWDSVGCCEASPTGAGAEDEAAAGACTVTCTVSRTVVWSCTVTVDTAAAPAGLIAVPLPAAAGGPFCCAPCPSVEDCALAVSVTLWVKRLRRLVFEPPTPTAGALPSWDPCLVGTANGSMLDTVRLS